MRRGGDDGSISLEWVLFTPLIFLVLLLIYAFARVAWVNGNLDSATRDAARVASQAPSLDQAQTAADDALATQFAQFTCENNAAPGHPPVVVIAGAFTAGSTLTVTATCRYSLADLGLPGAPGTVTVSSRFSSLIDYNRTLG